MQKLVFINGAGKQIDLTSGNFGITNWEGFSNANLNIQTQQVPFEDGGVFLDALIEQRDISVTVAIQDNNNLELRYQKKRELISALNPKLGEGTLIYTNNYLSRQIKAVPQIPLFENKNSNDVGTLKATVSFTCCSPYWEDIEETQVIFNYYKQPVIQNDGDVNVGMDIDLIVENATDLKVENKTTKKSLEINGVINKPIHINTNTGKKEVYEQNFGTDVINYLSLISCYIIEETNRIIFGTTNGYVGYTTDNFKSVVFIQKLSERAITTIVKHNGKYYFGGIVEQTSSPIFTSTDLITFTQTDKYGNIYYFERIGMFIIINEDYIYNSSDGETFTQVYNAASSVYMQRVIDTGAMILISSRSILLFYSTNGSDWSTKSNPLGTNFSCEMVVFKDSLFIASGGGTTSFYKGTINATDFSRVEGAQGVKFYKDERGFLLTDYGYYTKNGITFNRNEMLNIHFNTGYYNNTEGVVLLFAENILQTTDYSDARLVKGRYIPADFSTVTKDKIFVASLDEYYLYESNDGKDFKDSVSILTPSSIKILMSDNNSQIVLLARNSGKYSIDNGKTFSDLSSVGFLGKYIKELKHFIIYNQQRLWTLKDGVLSDFHTIQLPTITDGTQCIYYNNNYYFSKGNINVNNLLKVNATTYVSSTVEIDIGSWFTDFLYIDALGTFFACYQDKLYISSNIENWTLQHTFESNIKRIIFIDKWNIGFVFLEDGSVYKFINTDNFELFLQATQTFKSVANNDDTIYMFTETKLLQFVFTKGDNIINRLSVNSEMNITLEKGENIIAVTTTSGSVNVIVKYRQKYIGV